MVDTKKMGRSQSTYGFRREWCSCESVEAHLNSQDCQRVARDRVGEVGPSNKALQIALEHAGRNKESVARDRGDRADTEREDSESVAWVVPKHWPECWMVHHKCAIAEIERLREIVNENVHDRNHSFHTDIAQYDCRLKK